jgi:hypothetical protein
MGNAEGRMANEGILPIVCRWAALSLYYKKKTERSETIIRHSTFRIPHFPVSFAIEGL